MSRIHVLDVVTANQIAAGEVVERPSSAVKELVENSIDAGASRVDVEIRSGGKELIRVTDNGMGMSADDAELCLDRHATSKIRSVEDLQTVLSLGFRGEALPSIAAVSRLELRTWDGDTDTGTSVVIEGGRRVRTAPIGAPQGTTIWVRDLFFNTPARYKFMKSTQAESRAVLEILGFTALAHPEIALKLTVDNKEVLQTSGSGDLLDVIGRVMGRDIARELVPADLGDEHLRVTGFVGRPHLVRASRASEAFFLNGRYIRSRMIASAVERAYERVIPAGRFPAAVLMLSADPCAVDVNVHPTKMEVKFEDESEVYRTVSRAVSKAVATPGPVVGVESSNDALPPAARPSDRAWGSAARPAYGGGLLPAMVPLSPHIREDRGGTSAYPRSSGPAGSSYLAASSTPVHTDAESPFRILGQALDTYIVCADDRGLVLVDQHNSHERILYEGLKKSVLARRAGKLAETQGLLVPIALSLGPEELAALMENWEALAQMGFELAATGDSVEITALPMLFGGVAGKGELEAVVAEMASATDGLGGPMEVEERLMVSMSCKTAIKAGKRLCEREMRALVDGLLVTERPFTCPHGRPTFFRLPEEEIEKRLGRR